MFPQAAAGKCGFKHWLLSRVVLCWAALGQSDHPVCVSQCKETAPLPQPREPLVECQASLRRKHNGNHQSLPKTSSVRVSEPHLTQLDGLQELFWLWVVGTDLGSHGVEVESQGHPFGLASVCLGWGASPSQEGAFGPSRAVKHTQNALLTLDKRRRGPFSMALSHKADPHPGLESTKPRAFSRWPVSYSHFQWGSSPLATERRTCTVLEMATAKEIPAVQNPDPQMGEGWQKNRDPSRPRHSHVGLRGFKVGHGNRQDCPQAGLWTPPAVRSRTSQQRRGLCKDGPPKLIAYFPTLTQGPFPSSPWTPRRPRLCTEL